MSATVSPSAVASAVGVRSARRRRSSRRPRPPRGRRLRRPRRRRCRVVLGGVVTAGAVLVDLGGRRLGLDGDLLVDGGLGVDGVEGADVGARIDVVGRVAHLVLVLLTRTAALNSHVNSASRPPTSDGVHDDGDDHDDRVADDLVALRPRDLAHLVADLADVLGRRDPLALGRRPDAGRAVGAPFSSRAPMRRRLRFCSRFRSSRDIVASVRERGRAGGTRTPDRRFWRPMLYQLSYCPRLGLPRLPAALAGRPAGPWRPPAGGVSGSPCGACADGRCCSTSSSRAAHGR